MLKPEFQLSIFTFEGKNNLNSEDPDYNVEAIILRQKKIISGFIIGLLKDFWVIGA